MKKNTLLFILLCLQYSCVSRRIALPEDEVNEKTLKLIFVKALSSRTLPNPLPSYTPIIVGQQKEDGSVTSHLAYRGWDMNRDGLIDMVEVLGKDGRRQAAIYDLDFDGKPDLTKKSNNP